VNATEAIDIIKLTAAAIDVVIEAYPAVVALIDRLQGGGDVELSELEDIVFRVRARAAEIKDQVDKGRFVGPPEPEPA